MEPEKKERLLVVDGLNQFIRNWTIVPATNVHGEPNGGVVGFLRSLKVIMRDVHPSLVVVAWDGEGGSIRRRSMHSGYKDGRRPRVNRTYNFESPEASAVNLKVQYTKLRQLLDLLGVVQLEVPHVEADDVIAFVSKHVVPGKQKVIVSSDRDLWQLLDRKTLIYSPTKKKYYSMGDLRNDHGILPENYILMKALMGDGSDNVKGIKGIGEKTTIKLFPFLGERLSTLTDVFQFSEEHKDESPKYRSILDNRELLIANVELMQLTSPIISAHSAMVLRKALESPDTKFVFSEFKLALLRDGIQLTDSDFFAVFQEYQQRTERGTE